MEAHEGICQLIVVLANNILIVDILRNRIVDVEQCHCIIRSTHADVLRKSTIDVHLAGYRDATACQTAVDIAWLETKLAWECRPALVGKSYILARTLVILSPVEQCELKLCHTTAQVRIVLTLAHLGCHILANVVDTWIVLVLFVRYEQVKL